MGRAKVSLLVLMFFITNIFISGCWNYKEVDKLSVVSGVAIDKGENSNYLVTVEILKISGGKESKTTSKTVSAEGKTLFDAARNMISMTGNRLYWSHTKVVILSKSIASEGVSKALEWFCRDSETREDVPILISKEEKAKDIFTGETTKPVISETLLDILEDQRALSKAIVTDILQYDSDIQIKGNSIIIPTIYLKQESGKKVPEIMGSAIIKKDKLIGFLDGEETKVAYIIKNEVKYGVLVEEMSINDQTASISLEIFDNKTKIKPIIKDDKIQFDVDISTEVAIDEVNGKADFFDQNNLTNLKGVTEDSLKTQVQSLFDKMKSEFDADIFGMAGILWHQKPQFYNNVSENWDQTFKDLSINIHTNVHIENNAILQKSIKVGE